MNLDTQETPTEISAPEKVTQIIAMAEKRRASDIHLQTLPEGIQVSLRVDGVLAPMELLPRELGDRVIGRIKYLSRLKTYQESMPQDGRMDRQDAGSQCDIRVATYPTITGEKVVLRMFGASRILSIPELGFDASITHELEHFLGQSSGLLLLTGPAGSGKTTTIYACLRRLAESGTRHIITVEDPVEQMVPGIMQTEIHPAQGLTFACAARHLLRQDPQVLVIGEIRDEETAEIVARATLTGHLVIATLHAGSCKGVFERLFMLCRDHHAVCSGTELVINQRLLRKSCNVCKGNGCHECHDLGYQGSVPVAEWIHLDDALRQQMISSGPGIIAPTRSLRACAGELAARGITTEKEIQRVLGA